MKTLRKVTDSHVSMPAPDLAFIIAAVLFRKVQPERMKSPRNKKRFIEFFGNLNGMQWLSVAIQVHNQIDGRPLVIELDQEATIPKVRLEEINGKKATVPLPSL
jgi:hypothetical protein